MSQVFEEDGTVTPVTVLSAEPMKVTRLKSKEKDGYEAVQVETKISTRKAKKKEFRGQAEFKIDSHRIAGCRCTTGVIDKSATAKIMRGETLVGSTRIKSLHQNQTAVDKVKAGTEFGILLSPSVDFKIGDSIIATTG